MRLDKYLVEKEFFSSRARAKEAIEKGDVLVSGAVTTSPDSEVSKEAHIEVLSRFPWVSRGALKLIAALDEWHIDPKGMSVLDIGASKGGFTEVLLSRGAREVYAVDVGHGQLHPKLSIDSRVENMEGVDIRSLSLDDFQNPFPLIVGDLSFISLGKVLPQIQSLLARDGKVILLVKPQFELGPGATKKGIIRDDSAREEALKGVINEAHLHGLSLESRMTSPVVGGSGNIEYLILLRG